jgi:hypothetical protein
MHIRSFRISGVRAYRIGSPNGWSRLWVVGENIILGFQSYAVTACLPASLGLLKTTYIPFTRRLQGCLSCGIKVGISSFYIGLRESL